MKPLFTICVLLSLSACSTIIEGRSQEITVNTSPPGASCDLIRQDVSLGNIESTPGGVYIQKTKYDIKVVCKKKGYETATYLDKSDYAAAAFGNILIGGLIGAGVDAGTGAQNKYDTPVNITLSKK